MDMRQLTDKAMEHEARLAAHEEELKTLFNQQKNIEKLADSTHELAKSVEALAGRVSDMDERLNVIEEEGRYKARTVWAGVVSGVLGAAVTSALAVFL